MSNRIFTQVPGSKPRTNKFDLSHDRKMSLNFGDLVPCYIQEVIPSDHITIRSEIMMRFAPMVFPVMHRVNVFTHFFFVPNRILWSGFEDFITGNLPAAETPAAPYFPIGSSDSAVDVTVGSLADYLGLPITPTTGSYEMPVSALPFAAYQRIWNDYYRDQNLQAEHDEELVDGRNDSGNFFQMRKRAWTKDYFTSALPWPQKGDDVMLPIGSLQDVNVYADRGPLVVTQGAGFRRYDQDDFDDNFSHVDVRPASTPLSDPKKGDAFADFSGSSTGEHKPIYYDPDGTLRAATSDLEFEAASINNLRRAFRLQEWLEKNARGGTRYTESIQVHFGIRPQDSRLQRPEYIGGSMQPVTISEVLNTVGTEERPQGDMAGHGVSVGSSKRMKYFAREHGYIIGIMSVMPVPAYQQGIPRHFSKFDRFQYYWRDFAHIGEQEILNKELVLTNNEEHNNGTFGYTPRYAEYRFIDSTVHGDFRTSLADWHMSRIFDPANPPALNEDFIEMRNNEVDRIFAVQDDEVQKLWCHVFHNVRARRPIPKFGVPKF